MNEDSTERTDPERYEIVGWLSITSAVLILPTIVLGMILEIGRKPVLLALLVPYVVLMTLSVGFALYALYRLRGLLNDRYQFHDVDNLITAIIILGTLMLVVGFGAKTVGLVASFNARDPWALLPFAAVAIGVAVIIGIPLSILNIIFSVRLLRLRDDLHGLLKPYAFTNLVASALFATFFLAILGFLLDAACSIMLGLIFLRAARGLPHPEFV